MSGRTSDTAASFQHQGDMLNDIFERQAALASFYRTMRPEGFYSRPSEQRCTMWTRAIVHECCELDDELGWKPWKNEVDREATRGARLKEMADILHFFTQLALDQGFSSQEIYQAYCEKNEENRKRQTSDPRYMLTSDIQAGDR
jgi:NTP pyrophosphatase (non-canonical NTP hydrolase)